MALLGFDPLAVAIDQARREGVELHAWINVLPAWKGSAPPKSRRHVFHRHPEWFLTDRRGVRLHLSASEYTILNPCLPEVRDYLVSVVRDLVRRYSVDGVHMDYVRFIRRDEKRGRDFPYDRRSLLLFREATGATPFDAPAAMGRLASALCQHAVLSAFLRSSSGAPDRHRLGGGHRRLPTGAQRTLSFKTSSAGSVRAGSTKRTR